jgi:fumarate reductase iron-sulfur subunit
MRLLRGRLRHGAHAAGFRRRRGLNKIARFRWTRATKSVPTPTSTKLVGDDDGVFGCMSLLGCHDVCPKIAYLPLATFADRLRALPP